MTCLSGFRNRLSFILVATTSALSLTSAAQAATLTGNAFFVENNGGGDLLNVGRVDDADASGTATLDTSRVFESGTDPEELTARPKIDVGEGQTGLVTIEGEGTVIELTGTGTGSKLEIGDDPGGDGTVVIQDGATVILTGDEGGAADGNNVFVQFGEDGGTGEVTVDDATLLLEGFDTVAILASSNTLATGTFNVINGAEVQVLQRGDPGDDPGQIGFIRVGNGGFGGATGPSDGAMLVDSSTILISSELAEAGLFVGTNGGTGEVAMTNGSVVTIEGPIGSYATIGGDDDSSGRLTLSNTSELNLNGPNASLNIGGTPNTNETAPGFGEVSILSGSSIDITARNDAGVAVQVGEVLPEDGTSSVASLTVSGDGSRLTTADSVQIGQTGGDGTTTAILTVENGGRIEAADITIAEGGTLTGSDGSLSGNTIIEAGGVLAVGSSPGEMIFEDDLIVSGGILELEVGADAFDIITVLGDFIIEEPVDIFIEFLDDAFPEVGETYQFFNIEGEIVSDEETLALSMLSLPDGIEGQFFFDEGLSFEVTEAVNPIPLPAAGWLLLASLGGMSLLRRRTGNT